MNFERGLDPKKAMSIGRDRFEYQYEYIDITCIGDSTRKFMKVKIKID